MDIRSAVPDILLTATMAFDQETDKLVKPQEVRVNRYITYLEIFLNELEQEESKKKEGKCHFKLQEKLSDYMRQSMADGKF